RSGAWLVDRDSGATTGALEFVRGGREVFETALLPSVVRPLLTPWAEAGSSPVEDLQADDPEPTDPA
ncbi:MAG TPA: hypothetical protein PKC18_10580, partial [Lacipirellulaceae bacterium]|nr:hypothetical protein [Lacipirellulaceae bacterium]